MAGDCTYKTHYGTDDTLCPSKSTSCGRQELEKATGAVRSLTRRSVVPCSPNFELIEGMLYRKKLERGFINYREVLDEDRRQGAIAAFHRRRPGTQHLSLEETYKSVAQNYWWEGMYFQIRDTVLGCLECVEQRKERAEEQGKGVFISKTMTSYSRDILSKLRSQREEGLFCDITLRTNGRSYSAHRAVLAAVSEYFQEVFTEIDSNTQADIDLTGFSEESLLSLLDFSYSSTLRVRVDDLPEVSAMARHLGMWPAVEACSDLQKELEQNPSRCPRAEHRGQGLPTSSQGSRLDPNRHPRDTRRKSSCDGEVRREEGVHLSPGKCLTESPRRSPRGPWRPTALGHNGLPLSPTQRMKLMDFKSPSSKKPLGSRPSSPQVPNAPSSPHASPRLLRSTPGAAQEVQRLLPRPESPRRGRKPQADARPASTSRPRPRAVAAPVRVKQEAAEAGEDEEDHLRALEKYHLMNVLGLQRTSLLPRPEDLIGWRQKKRLRKLKANNYSLTKRRKPHPLAPGLSFATLPLSLPLCNPANARLLHRIVKKEPEDPRRIGAERQGSRRPVARLVPPSDRSMRSQGGVLPDLLPPRQGFVARELKRLMKSEARLPRKINPIQIKAEPGDYAVSATALPSLPRSTPPRSQLKGRVATETVRALRYNSGRQVAKTKLRRCAGREVVKGQRKPRDESWRAGSQQGPWGATEGSPGGRLQSPDPRPPSDLYSHPLYRVIKEEPADPLPVDGAFPDPPSPDLGKRQSKPPVKMLDPGFLFSFCRPPGAGAMGVKREEESVDICLTRSVARGERFGAEGTQTRVLRARGSLSAMPLVKREREERSVSQSRVQRLASGADAHHLRAPHQAPPPGARASQDLPKKPGKLFPLRGKSLVQSESVRRTRLKQLRGPRSQVPKTPKAPHTCLQCHVTYRDCDALVMHRMRHIEGKHWPCPLCSKTFFRQKNVRNHIRTHDQKLYKCRRCMAAS